MCDWRRAADNRSMASCTTPRPVSTSGMAEDMLALGHQHVRRRIRVVSAFTPRELPRLLLTGAAA